MNGVVRGAGPRSARHKAGFNTIALRLGLFIAGAMAVIGATAASGADSRAPLAGNQLPGPDAYPSVKELPDPLLFNDGTRNDGTRVKTPQDWPRRRAELVDLILGYEYGRLPTAATTVKPQEIAPAKAIDATGATEHSIVLTMGPMGKISTHLFLTVPAGSGPFPVIVKGDVTWGRVKPAIVADVVKHGYMLAEFDRTEIEPDKKDAAGGVRALYPDADWGTLAAWAWGYHRVVDYLLTRADVDAGKVVVTGHSRGGKAALLAGVLDERVALTVPNGSGCGGAGCYRVQPPGTEDIAAITDHFPYWFGPRFPQFVGHVDRLPFDQHEVRALVAPRALLSTDALGDTWANGPGTQASYEAAREVFKFLGAGDKIGIHFREGKHDQTQEDFAALLAFADRLFFNKASDVSFDTLPFPRHASHLLYVAEPGIRDDLQYGGHGVLVFDIDDGHRFVRRIPFGGLDHEKPMNVKGICASAATGRLYVSTLKTLSCLDLTDDKVLWEKTYDGGCDRMAIVPDGKSIYLPSLEGPFWRVVDADTGDILAKIEPGSGSHNTIAGPDGKWAYLAGLRSRLLTVADTQTRAAVRTVGPFDDVIRPFTIDGDQKFVFVNVNGLLGFEVGDLATGKLLHRVEVQGFNKGPTQRHGCPSHGIGLTPDGRELWLCDSFNRRLHVFDATVMPPKQVASVELRDEPGWVTFSIDGRYAYPSTGDIIDTASRKVVGALKDEQGREVQSEKLLEVDFADGKAVRAGEQFGISRAKG